MDMKQGCHPNKVMSKHTNAMLRETATMPVVEMGGGDQRGCVLAAAGALTYLRGGHR